MDRGARRIAIPGLLMSGVMSLACSASGVSAIQDEHPVGRGAELFAAVCSECHGRAGDGSTGEAPALDASGHAWHHPDAHMREWISTGKPGLGPSMPGFGDVLEAEGVEDVLAYLHTLWTEEQRHAQEDISARYDEALRRFGAPGQPPAAP